VTHTPFGGLSFVEIIGDIATADKPTAFAARDELTIYTIAYHFVSCISENLLMTRIKGITRGGPFLGLFVVNFMFAF
jgi:hypothetical protein